jgi:hypothetical protein
MGKVGSTGWWYYFPIVLAVKTPLAFLLLLGLGAYLCWQRRAKLVYILPLALSLGILLPAMTSRVNIGVRHILPIYIGFSIVAAVAVVQLAEWAPARRWAGFAAALLALWIVIAGIASHPDYLPYFNELVHSEPDRVLVDSDYDWGQDTKRLARRLRELGATEVSFGEVVSSTDQYLEIFPGLPHIHKINPLVPAEGWTAVSPTLAKTTQYGMFHKYPNLKPWFEYLEPKEKVGTLLLYYVPPGSLPRVQ